MIGCLKLDGVDHAEKLAQILAANEVRSLLVVRMEGLVAGDCVRRWKKRCR